jgi:hypothetical protein
MADRVERERVFHRLLAATAETLPLLIGFDVLAVLEQLVRHLDTVAEWVEFHLIMPSVHRGAVAKILRARTAIVLPVGIMMH